jgi:hypothetical protein
MYGLYACVGARACGCACVWVRVRVGARACGCACVWVRVRVGRAQGTLS